MVALRALQWRDDQPGDARHPSAPAATDWLPLQQAACELGVSISTARRMIRQGKLRNRVVPRRGGFQYLVYMPASRHASVLGDGCTAREAHTPVDLDEYRRHRDAVTPDDALQRDLTIRRLEEQVEHLSEALSRSLKLKQKALPAGMGEPQNARDPYARYRWLVRRKRWWPF
jgi:hypothetical protein